MTNERGNPLSPSDELWEALARHLAGERPAEEAAAVERWLDEEPGRRETASALGAALARARFQPPDDLDVEAALRRVSSRLDEPFVRPIDPGRRKEPAGRPSHRTFMRIAAAVVLLLGGALLWRSATAPDGVTVAAAPLTFQTGIGMTDSIQLVDGTRIVLGPGSRLRAAAGYGEHARTVDLEGIALFDVVHDAQRPFTVRSGGANVLDLGTVFTVSGWQGAEVRVVVTSGAVELAAPGALGSRVVTLTAGDRAVLIGGETLVERGAATDEDLAWASGRLVLDDAPLARVAVELRRWYGIELRFPEDEMAGRHLTASFQGETADQVLDAVALALGVRIEQRGDTAVITGPREER